MCRIDPELYWHYLLAENENNPTFEQAHKANHYVWLRNHRPYGPLVAFDGCCPFCRPDDGKAKPPHWRSLVPSTGRFSVNFKELGGGLEARIHEFGEDMRGISKEFGGVGIEEERGGMKWVRVGIQAIVFAFLMLLFLYSDLKRNNALYEKCMERIRCEY
ncbi:hypothetical protein BZA77DRAFT_351216 [Pyronema omphalodes]|nr:hypothetical protein BZA77DRAFT_351216 [Pyronema omphalodes]